jgi:hypothetical protein
MDGQNRDHDRWMDKITNALRSLRQADVRTAERVQVDASRHTDELPKLLSGTHG